MSKSMSYETTPFKMGSSAKAVKNKAQNNVLSNVGTGQLIWHVTKRHRFFLVSTYAIILTSIWLFPPLPDILMSVIGR